ncbi:MAG TPA: phospho-sugar mutase [Cyclobacteriaceae bacterium]|mgnify:CR=1 FL=1|nr:phospho-sugar mutase [Cyclobacteriaceae bacterium]
MDLLSQSKNRAQAWLTSSVIDEDSKMSIRKLLENADPKQLIDSFYKDLEFGTGGLRGVMGVGSNCMNKFTVGSATQGLANYLKKSVSGEIKVAIAYDSRNNSKTFAQITADVFSANGIFVYLFPELRPTPLLSFAIRYLQCQSGIVITASHNPKEYNGYKAYWSDGAQLVPPHDKNVIQEVNSLGGFADIKFNADPAKIKMIDSTLEDAYYREVEKLIPKKESIARQSNIPIVYSSIHGAGITMVPECLSRLGFKNLIVVEEQRKPDGDFPTVHSPNPEEKSAMELSLKKAKEVNAELVMATDPDTDRVGIGIKDDRGEFFLLNGNQAFSLMMWFIMKNLSESEKKSGYIAKTIVTSELVDTIANKLGVDCYNTLTGFKYIAELMGQMEGKKKFIAAGEESYGYMVGDFVRDKDAVSACAFFAALAASAKDEGYTLYDWLIQMYVDFGFYKEGLVNLVRKGAEGEQEIKRMMEKFRNQPPDKIGGKKVVRMLDYKTSLEKNLLTQTASKIDLPASDVLQFYTEDGSKISVRPSGTEPKIKFYISVKTDLNSKGDFKKVSETLDSKIKAIEAELV